jgi:hypothetical protein
MTIRVPGVRTDTAPSRVNTNSDVTMSIIYLTVNSPSIVTCPIITIEYPRCFPVLRIQECQSLQQ